MVIKLNNIIKNYMLIIFILNLIMSSGIVHGLVRAHGLIIYTVFDIITLFSLLNGIVYFIYLIFINKRFELIKDNKSYLFLLMYSIFISNFFSINKYYSNKGLMYWGVFYLLGVFLIYNYSSRVVFNKIKLSMIIITYINMIYIILKPDITKLALDSRYEMTLVGLFPHKSSFAIFLVLVISLFIIEILYNKKNKIFISINILFLIIMLFASKSATSIIILVSIIILLFYLKNFNKAFNTIKYAIYLNILFFIFIFYGQRFSNIFFEIFGRDMTLTGRTDIWMAAWNLISQNSLLGYGYNAIWNTDYFIITFNKMAGFSFIGTHNGWLDLLLQFGVIGFLCIVLIFFITPMFKIKYFKESIFDRFIVIYYWYLIMYMISESSFSYNNYQTFLLIIIIIYLNKNYKYKYKIL